MFIGDFNARVGNRTEGYERVIDKCGEDMEANGNGKRLLDFCASMGLAVTNTFFKHKAIHRYTWEARGTRSIIDYILTDFEFRKSVRNVRVFRGFFDDTDHYLICSELSISRPKVEKVKSVCKRIRVENLQDEEIRQKYMDMISEKFRTVDIKQVQDIESEWVAYRDAVVETARECLGTTVCKDGKRRTSWWNDEVRAACKRKKKAYKKWLQTRAEADRELYVDERNRAKQIIVESKKKSWEDFGNNLERLGQAAGKPFCTVIKNLRKGGKKEMNSVLSNSGELIIDPRESLERWREYFEHLLNVKGFHPGGVVNSEAQGEEENDVGEIMLEEVESMVNKLHCHKAAGIDEIRPEMVKYSGKAGMKWLHRVVKLAWSVGKVPSDWAKAVIAPIYKQGNRKDCNNYRGISLISIPGKVFTGILEGRVRSVVERKLDENQCGFRPQRGCQDQIFSMQQVIEKCYERNRQSCLCFVDLEKPYDRVPREKMFAILGDYGIKGRLLKAIKGIYVDNWASVRIDGRMSSWFRVLTGVRQGCNLSPLLFVVYMDHLLKGIKWQGGIQLGRNVVSSLAYADDLVLMADCAESLQSNIVELENRCNEYGMKISLSKTKLMSIGKKFNRIECQIGDTKLEQVDNFKYLGCVFSQDGNIVSEIESRCRKANAVSSQLRSTVFCKKEVSSQTKLSLHRSVFRPTLLYGSESWVDSGYLIHKLEVTDMKVARMIAGTNRWEQWQEGTRNEEIKANLGMNSMDEAVRINRLRWWGHVRRMEEDWLPRRIMDSVMEGKRSRGRPRRRWLDSVSNDLKIRGIELNETTTLIANRGLWRRLVNSQRLAD
ncbi:LINE-1 retrotransposable element ORF2 protein isoform X1 [Anabrus simplex]|uniref:LINE-1 retrotransposable element ORF2 protein isoform X1 n=1 Tax=Anabrus simplex TaxID=316456 RepID=UPI0035A30090